MIRLKTFDLLANAGDAASAPIVSGLLGAEVAVIGEAPFPLPNLIAIGSLVQWADARSVIWGAGLISEAVRPPEPPAKVLAVRGPLTARLLRKDGVACPDLYGDPGAFAPDFFPPPAARTAEVGVVPHYVDRDSPWIARAEAAGARVIDPSLPLPVFLERLAGCERIISSSLHGLIFAHAYGVPAAWIELSGGVIGGGFKFLDYYAGLGEPAPARLGVEADLDAALGACALPPRRTDTDGLAAVLLENRGLLDV